MSGAPELLKGTTMKKHFVFSCDGHIVEPGDLFLNGLPASMRSQAIVTQREDGHMVTRSGDTIMHRVRILENIDLGRRTLLGVRELAGRRKDMQMDGVDAELVFPSLGLWTFTIQDPEVELATTEVYNNWA